MACLLGTAWLARPAAAAVYYVDAGSASCSSAGPGTEDQPYCTITAAMNAHNGPGVTIIVKAGVYHEQVTVPASGASGNPFVLQAQSDQVVLDGADDYDTAGQWTLVASNKTFRASSVTWSPVQVLVDGARLDTTSATPDAMPANTFHWVAGEGLYVNLGGDSPGVHDTHVGHRSYGVSIFAKNWVTVDGFTILRPEDRGVYLQNACTNVTVSGVHESFSGGYGIQAVGGSAITFQSNVTADNIGHGIALISGASGCWIEGNESYRNSDPVTRVSNGIYLFNAPANTLCRNRCHDNQDTGMHMQSGSNDCVAYDNLSYNNGDHGYDHLFATGTTHVGDVAYGNHMDGFSIEGSASGVSLFDCISVNNGLTTNRFDLWIDGNSTVGFQSDYNIFWNSTSQPPIKYVATLYSSVSTYQSASGQDPHTLQTDPMFLDGAGGNFHLLPGSPAIDSGTSGCPAWPPLDADGQSRKDIPGVPNSGAGTILYADRGAFERISTAVGVAEPAALSEDLRLTPNPMRGRGMLRLALAQPGRLDVQMLDAQGRVVRHVSNRDASAGAVELEVPGVGDDGRPLQSGVYFLRVQAPGRTLRGRFQILR